MRTPTSFDWSLKMTANQRNIALIAYTVVATAIAGWSMITMASILFDPSLCGRFFARHRALVAVEVDGLWLCVTVMTGGAAARLATAPMANAVGVRLMRLGASALAVLVIGGVVASATGLIRA